MQYYPLRGTDMQVSEMAFGALPIQRRNLADATNILHRALDAGINFYDTARGYTDSEEKLGAAFAGKRSEVYLATKVSGAKSAADITALAERSLKELRTEYVDILQFHNPSFLPKPGGEDGWYDAMLALQRQGKVRYIGITSHKLPLAIEDAKSGLYATVQFPISYISTEEDLGLIDICKAQGVGLLCMKALAGGLLSNTAAIYSFFRRYGQDCLPLYGIQHLHELEAFLQAGDQPLEKGALQEIIAKDKDSLAGEFCRGCGYCLPCPANIPLPFAMRMSLMLKRANPRDWLTPAWHEKMQAIPNCTHCGQCATRCPYGLNPPQALPAQYENFMRMHADFHPGE